MIDSLPSLDSTGAHWDSVLHYPILHVPMHPRRIFNLFVPFTTQSLNNMENSVDGDIHNGISKF